MNDDTTCAGGENPEVAASPRTVQVAVDEQKCIGSGMCEMLEEAVFEINEDTNIAVTLAPGTLPADRAAIVIDRCPSSAISVVE